MNEINVMIRKRDALLVELGQLNGVIAGSFFAREMNGVTRFCLSRVQGGRQYQIYVAARHADAVRQGVQQHTRALEILSELGQINLKLIKKGAGGKDD
jgi:hypothetical protein